jgi:general secretion pathway protein D
MNLNYRSGHSGRVVFAILLLGTALYAKKPAADRFLNEGRKQEARKEWDAAVESYTKALAEDPSDVIYMMALAKARFQAGQFHIAAGRELRAQGRLEDAMGEFEKAHRADAASITAEQEIRTTKAMLARPSRPEERGMTPAEHVRAERDEKLNRILPPAELKAPFATPISVKMSNQSPRILFETVARYAGIDILFDPEYQPGKNASMELTEATLEQALDALALLTKSYWRSISPRSIFVTNDNPNKRRDYEEQVTRVFYLANVIAPQEIQEIVTVVRSVVDLQRVFPYSGQCAIVARGEADKIALAEKVIQDLDKPKSEVVIDILVIEAGKVFSRQVAAAIASTGLNVPVTFAPRASLQVATSTSSSDSSTSSTSSTTTSSVPLSALGHLASSDFAITLPGAVLQAALSDADTRILQSPQLRALDSVKSTLKIGDRQPTASGSFSAGTGATAVNALVNTQFTYIDVGVNVDLQAHVHDNGEVTMHLELEVSSVNGHVSLGGIDEPIIGQRKIVHDVRMKEGDVSLLAGLSSRQETKTVTGIPGLAGIPLLRRLFTGESIERNRSELMIAIIPHIVRRPEITVTNLRGVGSGTAGTIKLNYEPAAASQR